MNLFNKDNKLKLSEVRWPEEIGRTNNPNYSLFHKMVHHPTSRCFIFKDKIQVLVDARVLTLKSEQKKVIANMVTLNFKTNLKTTVQGGLAPVPKARLDVVNPMVEKQRANGLVPMMTKSEEIMWVHPDIVKDKQWESSKPKLKDKSCNAVSLAADDGAVTITSHSDSKEEKLALAA